MLILESHWFANDCPLTKGSGKEEADTIALWYPDSLWNWYCINVAVIPQHCFLLSTLTSSKNMMHLCPRPLTALPSHSEKVNIIIIVYRGPWRSHFSELTAYSFSPTHSTLQASFLWLRHRKHPCVLDKTLARLSWALDFTGPPLWPINIWPNTDIVSNSSRSHL